MILDWDHFSLDVFRLTCEVQGIPAPTFQEEKRAEWVERRYHSLNLSDVSRDQAGNVLARVPGDPGKLPLVISAHMDTVFPLTFSLHMEQTGDRASGPGIGDNSLGVAVLVALPDLCRAAGIYDHGDIWLAATTCEEGLGNLRGIREVTSRFGGSVRAYISLEGLGLGTILHRGLGVERYRVTVNTAGGHSWVDYGKPSAIHELVGLAARLTARQMSGKPRSSINIGLIQGGTSINTIAAQAWMDVDLRCETEPGLLELDRRFLDLVDAAGCSRICYSLEKIGSRPAAEISREHELVRLAARVLSEQSILPCYDIASTEANVPLSFGYPAITLGVAKGDHAHSAGEYIEISSIGKGLRQIVDLIAGLWIPV